MWDVAQYERLAHTAIQTLADYVERSQTGEGMVVSAPPLAELMEELDLRRLIRAGGLGEENFERWLATMLAHTTRLHHPGELAHQVAPPDMERADAAGMRPMALVAAACATSTGLHDDLDAVGAFCREREIWFHVDAAHGAAALLSPRHAPMLRGIAAADSIVWDAHKMLRPRAFARRYWCARRGVSTRPASRRLPT